MKKGGRYMLAGVAVFVMIVTWPGLGFAQLSDEEYVRQALAAGPEPIANGAAVARPEPDGTMRTIRQGTNGFTCLIMGTDRMCADKNSMEFIHALMHQQPPPDQLGFAYMYRVSAVQKIPLEPIATGPRPDGSWCPEGTPRDYSSSAP